MATCKTLLISFAFFLSTTAFAADLETLKADCGSCHGPDGVSTYPDVPTIAGQTTAFLEKTLRGFQFWDRPCVKNEYRTGPKAGTTTDMCEIASGLSAEDAKAISAWYAEQTFVPVKQEFDPALAEAGQAIHADDCEKCHAEGGSLAGKGPRLAGQWTEYLRTAMNYVPTGERLCPSLMERTVAELSREDMDRLLNFYASQQD